MMTRPARTAAPTTVLLFVFCLVLPAQAQQDPSRSRFLRWSYQDAGTMVQTVNPRTPLYVLGAAAVLAPLAPFDDEINPRVQDLYHRNDDVAGYLNFVNELGGPRVTLPVAGVFAASLITDDTRFQDAAFTSLQSLVYAGAISYGLKYTVGRMRPSEDAGALRFAPFSGNTSFPSGHTATAFAVLTPWVLYYPNVATYGLFAVSTGTAIARLARDRHWTTDVLAGGSIGFLTAYWLTHRHQQQQQPQEPGPSFAVLPALNGDGVTVSLALHL